MTELFAFCGLDCTACEAYQATQANDVARQQALLERWRVEYDANMDMSAVTCDGCSSCGRLGGYCAACPVRACSTARGLENCAACPDYACETLSSFLAVAPQARANLEMLRGRLNQN